MANGFDASSILSSYLEGANFVTRGMERAEEARRKAELEDAQGIAGESLGVVAPKYDANGNVIIRSAAEIAQSPEFKSLANRSGLQPVLMQGIQDPRVKAVRYVGAVKGSSDSSFIPVLQHLDEDGKVISEGPLTQDRSSSGNAPIGEMTVNDVFNHAASAVYAKSPELGVKMFEKAKQNALGALQEQFRTAPEAQRGDIAKVAQSNGYNLTDLVAHSGAQERKADLERGGWWVTDPITRKQWFEADPSVRTLGDRAHQVGTERGLKDNEQKRQQDLTLDQQEADARNGLRAKQILSDANANVTAQNQTFADRANLVLRDAQVKDAIAKRLNVQDQALFTQGTEDLGSSDPQVRARGEQTLASIPNLANELATQSHIQGVRSNAKLTDALKSNFKGMDEQQAGDLVAQNYHNLTKDEQQGVVQGLYAAARKGNRVAASALDVALSPHPPGKAPEMVKFDADGVKGALKNRELDEAGANEGRLGTKQSFDRLMTTAKITEGSRFAPYVNEAIADTYALNRKTDFKNAEEPMLLRSKLKADYGEGAVGNPEAYMIEVHDPLTKALKKAGVDPSFQIMDRASELVTSLRSNDINKGEAVATTVRVLTDPTERKKWSKILGSNQDGSFSMKELGDAIASSIKEREAGRLGKAWDATNRQFGLRYQR